MRAAGPVVIALIALAAIVAAGCGRSAPAAVQPTVLPPSADELPEEQAFLAAIDRTRGHRDIFSVIRDPGFVPAAAANLQPGEMVLGVDLGDARFAYPVNLLNHHEIVEHSSNGRELLACW